MQSVLRWLWLVFVSLVLVACSTVKTASATNQSASSSTGNKKTVAKNGAYFQNDGPADHIPVNLNLVPDAVPQEEPLIRSANLPYTALGMSFRPDTREKPYQATGRASWYGKQFHGRKTSSGEKYDMFAMTAAHPTLPIPSYARVTNLNNGKSVVVRVNDRGPFHKNRLMDLSYAAAYRLGFVKQGSAKIAIERVWPDAGGENVASTRPVSTARRAEDTPKYLQLGSFSKLANAEAMVQKMLGEMDDKYESKLGIVNQEGIYKVRLGPFRSSDAVRNAAENLHVETVVTSL
ncbi:MULTISPECIES: septal ring lytic transglycosylase RlpA family protein [Chromobacterium]|uniref:Endolytic peptidoglycan transglycosylase RlpA n=2 Tax=Chromobacterium TaxID=535 RepID=A0ABS3GPB7_9NEIS|nr:MULTISPECIES: septal ring lytic transglycosylase RlpA family protein [Chromobacterium]AXT44874.1 septal ring lytic transglycosylase RlpA family protein [Chromobacterium rhizoryzae]MBK0414699.1 septal ring lytic transglycosylase RlpA family protein [Chromobacterium haemolyticum]MBO0416078.1 septal ring lytic transglycosylase RlpA family protein [Chromobacterium haemolyticum]MBO0499423.1 septal ring lytic transglycosylase RlpA family protein [Chromobacterium haemolyticum]MDH0342936.1 septal r